MGLYSSEIPDFEQRVKAILQEAGLIHSDPSPTDPPTDPQTEGNGDNGQHSSL